MPRIRAAPDAVHTPFFPGEKEENWWVLLADVSSNALLAVQKARRARHARSVSCASRLTRYRGVQVSLSSKGKGLTKFRAAAAKAPAPGSAAGSTATPRPGGEPASAAGTVSAAKVSRVQHERLQRLRAQSVLTRVFSPLQADGDLVLPLKFRAPPAGLHLLQVRAGCTLL